MLSWLAETEADADADVLGDSRFRHLSKMFRPPELWTTVALNRSMSTELKLLRLENIDI
jgi:hypothetical protein